MSSYFVTGVSRGLGFEFLRQLSSNPANTVIGLARNKAATEAKVAAEMTRDNVHIVEADITDYTAVERAMKETSAITGGKLDYLIANAAKVSDSSSFQAIGDLDPALLKEDLLDSFSTNVIANIQLINIFMPLILKGTQKKVIALSTGLADLEAMRTWDLEMSSVYSISKAAMNAAIGKFSAQYRPQGVLFLSICPGMVNTGHYDEATPEQMQKLGGLVGKFKQFAPDFTGPATPEAAIKDVISVFEKASVANGDGGAYLSHFGNKQWL